MYQVVIVEDDPMVAAIDRRYTESVDGFSVAGCFKNGDEALAFLRTHPADLVILDYYMPRMNGDEFLDRMHAEGLWPSVIMVTSANSADTVRALIARGVCDYLIKPFEMERFQGALERFRSAREALKSGGNGIGQEELDRFFSGGALPNTGELQGAEPGEETFQRQGAPVLPSELPKGLNERTLSMILEHLKDHAGQQKTSEEIATMVGLSRITVRRYLAFLQDQGVISSEIDYQTGGRPGILYRYEG